MKPTSKTSLIACIAISGAFAAGFATGPASAQTHRGPFEFEFKYDAAEFGNIESAQNLVSRLHSVVSAYCGKASTMSPQERFETKHLCEAHHARVDRQVRQRHRCPSLPSIAR
jgi:hypothetical protein